MNNKKKKKKTSRIFNLISNHSERKIYTKTKEDKE